ncbi:MAG: hypothetical protein DRQ89_04375 [Epsilonproteobacteria bacterium]|nr:MAG: hypothetical protein DRQ89_04375 [Campylobacterota bacterium]
MKIFIPLILLVTLYSANLFSQAKDKEERKKRFSSDSEFSLLAVSGNSNNTALNLLTKNRWPIKINNIITFGGHYTYATDEETLDTKNWDINLRYERKVSKKLGFYLGTIYEVIPLRVTTPEIMWMWALAMR